MIYFIRMGETDFVKIGYSRSPASRLNDLQTAHPLPLKILAMARGNMKMERALHRHFKGQRMRGEWFNLDGPIKGFLDGLIEGGDANFVIGEERLLHASRCVGLDLVDYLT